MLAAIPGLIKAGGAIAGAAGSLFGSHDNHQEIPRDFRAPIGTATAMIDAMLTRPTTPFPYEMNAPMSALSLLGMGRGVDMALGGGVMPTLSSGQQALPPGMMPQRPGMPGGSAGIPGSPGPTNQDVLSMLAGRSQMKDPATGEVVEAFNPVSQLANVIGLISPQAAALLASGSASTPRYAQAYDQVEGQRDIQNQMRQINEGQAGSRTLYGRALASGDPVLAAEVMGKGNVEAARKMMKKMNKGKGKGKKGANRQQIADAFGITVEQLMGGA